MHFSLAAIQRSLALQHPCYRMQSRPRKNIQGTNMKERDLASMSIDQLWTLHEEVCAILSTKMDVQKRELERQLARLQGRIENKTNERRPYPKVCQKYRNPAMPSETWSGRGRQPHWVSTQLRSGKKFDELLIAQTH